MTRKVKATSIMDIYVWKGECGHDIGVVSPSVIPHETIVTCPKCPDTEPELLPHVCTHPCHENTNEFQRLHGWFYCPRCARSLPAWKPGDLTTE